MVPVIEATNISFSYGNKAVLHNIDLRIEQGDVLSLLGPNGSGKSTLLKVLLGFYKTSESVNLLGKTLKSYSQRELAQLISYVPQTHQIPFSYTVFDVVLMGRLPHIGLFSNYGQKDRDIAVQMLEKVGILHLRNYFYSEISGGERQLTFIARALAQESKIILMDEPVTGLDYGNQIKLLKFIKEFSENGYTFLKTTHYPDHALYVSNKVMMIKEGATVAYGEVKNTLTAENIKTLYGVRVQVKENKDGYRFCVPQF